MKLTESRLKQIIREETAAVINESALDKVQAGLDIAGVVGLFPPAEIIATPATIASLVLNTSRGKYGWALFDIFSLIPVAGKALKGGKVMKAASKAIKGTAAPMTVALGGRGLVELMPPAVMEKIVDAKTGSGEPLVSHLIDIVGKVPGIEAADYKALNDLWANVQAEHAAAPALAGDSATSSDSGYQYQRGRFSSGQPGSTLPRPPARVEDER